MKTFFDSSAFAKRYIAEKGSSDIDTICQNTDQLAICVICVPEIISALNRRVRERNISASDYVSVKDQLIQDVRDAEIVNLTDDVVAHSLLILERNTIRAMDALHVAAAHAWKADLFVSSDKLQIKAANKQGLKTKLV
ncbi:MAG TPA: type II toxin-antitoxin system VapC family toxin [Kiritimatiellia bacterium]|nr:type II toxin-antitoxin system VapC family toxin [Kiritimatiellia bacterium]HMO97652.1 type II toxin-antitoxin system VapC family toxin [Kiritimatiellia bacterium]HMP95513.1 type II toxin-antitoxin system VapC family toxin [Kiritimatiellia bacterium]